ncbi:MurR/RpiR family transcriptional regulator [Pseudonocardia acaciae]|uniref:MurR/RpiR family transcriptional regulator n=1 Tax=Pseudonocardia acaciae TaxID=551276 RepID=UPI000684F1B3|nr:MurR/RpiR family transcriptional regulator [Pseudonocardia acaciae]
MSTSSHTPSHTSSQEGPSVADLIRTAQDRLSPAELKLSRVLLAHYPAAGLESSHALAQRANVSAPTVLRFLTRLGFAGYRDFQGTLRAEVQARRASPLTLPARITAGSPTSELAGIVAETATNGIRLTFQTLAEHEFERAVSLISDPAHRITCFGGRFSHLLATYLDRHLRLLRPRTRVHTPHPNDDPSFLVDLGRRDVCVAFDVRRYQDTTITLARAAADRGAKVILVTDPWLSPIADIAGVVLSARVEAGGSFDSLVAPTALTEALIAAVHARLGSAADERMRTIEDV